MSPQLWKQFLNVIHLKSTTMHPRCFCRTALSVRPVVINLVPAFHAHTTFLRRVMHRTKTAVGFAYESHNSRSIVTYVKDESDLQMLIADIAEIPKGPQHSRIPEDELLSRLDKLVRQFLTMKADPRNIYAFVNSNRKVVSMSATKCDALLSNARFLHELQIHGNRMLLVLERNPAVWSAPRTQLDERVATLRKLGLVEGSLQRVVSTWPNILTLRRGRIDAALNTLRDCQFARSQITTILEKCPTVLSDEPSDIERRFQYVYFTMGLRSQAEMVSANLFAYTLAYTRRRHTFLVRLGLYETPDKKGHTRRVVNPKLARIIDCSDSRFTARCASGIPLEEYQVFARNLEMEEEEEEEEKEELVGKEEEDDVSFPKFY